MEKINATAQVTPVELERYARLIYEKTGIRVSPKKRTLLSNRLRRRARETGHTSFEAYYQHVRKLGPNEPEWDAFLQEITTHETFLFRDEGQWEWFEGEYLPQCAADARAGQRPRSLRIWSAAASTGDEAYTIACCIAASLVGYKQWEIEILGTDIGTDALAQAKRARFGPRAMRLVPESYKRRFFRHLPDEDMWEARPALCEMVEFKQHNLMDALAAKPFDLICLKNVLIYFDTQSKTKALKNVRAALKSDGILVAGGTEGVADLLRDFDRVQPWLFQMPTRQEVGV